MKRPDLKELEDGRLVELVEFDFNRKARRLLLKGWYEVVQAVWENRRMKVTLSCKPAKMPEQKGTCISSYEVGEVIEQGLIEAIHFEDVPKGVLSNNKAFFVFIYSIKIQ